MTSNKSNYQRTAEWLAACGKEVGNNHHLATQVGCHLEEIGELLDELLVVGSTADNESLVMASTRIKGIAHRLKQGNTGIRIKDRVSALDALCDSEVTGHGVAYLAGFDMDEASRRVLFSNDAKLVDGKAILGPGGKIQKPAGWVAPFLGDCV